MLEVVSTPTGSSTFSKPTFTMDDSFGLILIRQLGWDAILLDVVARDLPLGLRGKALDSSGVERRNSNFRRCVTLCVAEAVVPLLYVQIHI